MTPTRLRVTGGPSPATLKVHVDGAKQESVSRIEIVADVNDAVRATITRISTVNFDGEAVVASLHTVELRERRDAPGGEEGDVIWVVTHTATGPSRVMALQALAAQLDAEEKTSGQ